jgi:hypothetical protein
VLQNDKPFLKIVFFFLCGFTINSTVAQSEKKSLRLTTSHFFLAKWPKCDSNFQTWRVFNSVWWSFCNEANYYYEIIHCDYNWVATQIQNNIYKDLTIKIQDYTNSFNTLQIYSHYKVSIPNQFTQQLRISGNYILKVLDENKDVVFLESSFYMKI